MPKLLVSLLWVGTLVGAFFAGRLTMKDAAQADLALEQATSRSVLTVPTRKPGSEAGVRERQAGAGEVASGEKPSVQELIAAVRAQMQGSAMPVMMNPSAMMKLMAPLAGLSPAEVEEALAEVERTVTAPQQKMVLYTVLLGRLAETDGAAALAYADEHLKELGPMGQGARMSAMSTWAQRDPDAAWEYYQSQKDGDSDPTGGPLSGGRMMLAPLFSNFAARDMDDALDRLGSLSDSERPMAINGLIQGSAWDDERRASLLAESERLDPETQQQVRQQIVSQWAMMDAEGAVEWSASLPEEERGNLMRAAAGPLLLSDPERGAEVLLEHTPDAERPGIYANIVGQWASRDPNAAGEWLGAQPQGLELDQARATFSNAVASRDPESAMAWAMSVQDPANRAEAVGNTYRQWSRSDPQAAESALQNAGLNLEQMQQVRGGRPPTETPVPPAR